MCWLQGEGIVTFSPRPRHLQQRLSIRASPFGSESSHNHPRLLECVEGVVSHVFFPHREPSSDPECVCPPWALPGDPESDARTSSLLHLPEAEKFLSRRRSRVQSDMVRAVWASMIQLCFVDFPRCFLKLCWKYLCDLVTN